MASSPIETKVTAGSLSAGAAGVVLWALSTYVFKGAVPQGVVSLVYLAIPAIVAGVAGYLAPHTPRASGGGGVVAVPPGGSMTSVGPVGPVDPATGRAPAAEVKP